MAKFCSNCGKEVNENADVCINCGKQTEKKQTESKPYIDNKGGLECQYCGGKSVSIQMINEGHLVAKHHGFFWWILIGWWWIPVKWLILFIPALIFKVFGVGKRQKIKNITYKMAVCQNCGKTWKIK